MEPPATADDTDEGTLGEARARRPVHLHPGFVLVVITGGVFGALARYGLSTVLPAPDGWPLPTLIINLTGGQWVVEAEIVGVPNLQFGATSALLLAAIGAAVTPILLAIPFLGPFLAIAVNGILLAIGIAGVTGLLGPILTPFVSGLRLPIYKQPQLFEVLPNESSIDPRVTITIDQIAAEVRSSDEDELVLLADISA